MVELLLLATCHEPWMRNQSHGIVSLSTRSSFVLAVAEMNSHARGDRGQNSADRERVHHECHSAGRGTLASYLDDVRPDDRPHLRVRSLRLGAAT